MLRKKIYLPIGLCLVLLLAIGFLSLRSDVPDEPIKVYKSVEPLPKSTAQLPVGDTSQGGHFHEDGTWHATPHPVLSDETAINEPETLVPEASSVAAFAETESETLVDWEHSQEARELAENFTRDWNDFQQYLLSKYHVLFNPDELTRIAETKQGRRKLKSQASAMVEETLDKLEELLTQLPPEMSHKLLNLVEAGFQQNNPGIPPKYLKESIEMIRARLN
ncbi:hypothetical protein F4Z99_05610 [Candidatus Poribacteria bacterium]|nr:hypothetical protein [Candidatus Poribacteria bacterium]MYB02184.1 hypothetical protein [Candidatus Poribacteria bacterium]